MPGSVKPLIIVADDDPNILRLMEFHLQKQGCVVRCAIDKATLYEHLAVAAPVLLLLDLRFGDHDGVEVLQELIRRDPTLNVAMLTAHGSIDTAVSAIKLGAFEYLTKPPDLNRLRVAVNHAVEKHRLRQRIEQLEQLVGDQSGSRPLWGESAALRRVQDLIASVAPTDATVLILGESGTGKELVARAIHEHSPREGKPFVPVNMAAMPRELVESTLFGHEKGAFTGADQVQKGCCEAADGGTLFLDEIGELEPELQAKLLRFLQERTIQRVGSSRIFRVDVRILAATNSDPEEQVRTGRLREDLYYRLNVVPIRVPPLRERREDVGVLATLFLQRSAARLKRDLGGFTADALAILTRYDWPGNVRQLENVVERMSILARGPEIGIETIPDDIRDGVVHRPFDGVGTSRAPSESASGAPGAVTLPSVAANKPSLAIKDMERQAIVDALTKSGGNVGEAARILGLGQATVYRKLKRYGMNAKDYGAR